MYSGFNLKLNYEDGEHYGLGKSAMVKMAGIVQNKLKEFISPNGYLDGSKLSDNWFPNVDVDVFIYHSHKDEKCAVSLAGWLSQNFDLSVFVDSYIWGYAPDLLKLIDKQYCYQTISNTYSYQRRNASTSHVHMMLATALDKMIDKTECIIFLNASNSISWEAVVNRTASPWIYHELATTKIIRKWKKDELIAPKNLAH